jgi:hypothetical protein
MNRELLQQALDALRRVGEYGDIYRYKNTEQSPYTQIYEAIDALNVELAKPEQEPYCWVQSKLNQGLFYKEKPRRIHTIPLYTALPRKPWVGLADEELQDILDCGREALIAIKKAEQRLKDKNTTHHLQHDK